MLIRFGVLLLWLAHFLPARLIGAIGGALGTIVYTLGRTRTTDTNLAACFPDLSERERKRLARRHYRALGRSVLELGILWWSSAQRIEKLVRMEGQEHFAVRDVRPVILLAPHLVGVDTGSARLAMQYEAAAIYTRQKNPLLDKLMLKGRTRFGRVRMIARQEGLRPAVKALKQRLPLYILPDMDFREKGSIFVPFFGVAAATVPVVSRLAKMTGACVVPVVTRQLPGRGYVVRFYPAWENFPTEDIQADTERMNAFIEERVREMPEQYFWVHKRFRTRPPGENTKFY